MARVTRCAAMMAGIAGLAGLSLLGCSGGKNGSAASSSDAARPTPVSPNQPPDTAWKSGEHRMDWWRDARFGMFIHWGLYSIPAGEWPGKGTGHAEWIRDTARIPVEEYEKLRDQFNPVKFNANSWVAAAKGAGMNYVCITTKHHDGFCLFDTKQTDWSIGHTPFKRDIMKEMAEACRAQGVVPCWYHSIMDWHQPDYVPRRPWEEASRPATGADFEKYNKYLKAEVAELLTNYGPIGIMWFDGQWEGTWTHERGVDLYNYCRSLQPNVIVNNRCDRGPNMGSINGPAEGGVKYAGDYLTPEQEIPATGLGTDWETCMTMNDHWGYNSHDHNFKSTEDLIRKLADIASKGGNFLLNVGPTAEGEIPPESLQRLKEIGAWMSVNGEAIHGTQAGPFEKLPWGRCTQKAFSAGKGKPATRLYLHVFNWPKDGKLVVPGLYSEPREAFLLSAKDRNLTVTRGGNDGDSLVIDVPSQTPDAIDAVVVLDVEGKPDVATMPRIQADSDIFVDSLSVSCSTTRENAQLRYTLDGSDPVATSPVASGPIKVNRTSTLATRAFRNGRSVSPIARRSFTKVSPIPAIATGAKTPGMMYLYFEGDWDRVPNFYGMKPAGMGVAPSFDRSQRPAARQDRFGFRYHGYIRIPRDGVYTFWTASDDGSNLYVDGQRVVNNDGLHSLEEKSGTVALAAGMHAITVDFFEKGGGHELDCWIAGPGMARKKLDPKELVTEAP
jgi:alpha-L-fucosidase